MDGRRFDAWTCALARRLRRRTALKAMAGGAIAGSAAHTFGLVAEACLEDGQFCSNDDECCGVCVSYSCVACVPQGKPYCENDNDCCSGKQECVNGVCKKRKKDGDDKKVNCDGQGCKKGNKGGHKKSKKKHKQAPAPQCDVNVGGGDCGFGNHCDGGQCFPGCWSSLDCALYTRCMPDGSCVPIECYFDSDCPDGWFCLSDFTCYDPSTL